ncbi:UDP-N-acetylglucosamine 2-epimerase [Bibersteinia trehalosi]|nr:UDP-N-acetylglucosamine 2-epimerase [Bibersteinia trehalosi]
MSKIKTLIVFGTRPEAIKLVPLIKLLQQDSAFELKICNTAQHRQMLDQVLQLFEIAPDYDLDLMQAEQDLGDLTSRILQKMHAVLSKFRPHLVIVHGDTTTSFATSLAAFYQKIPVAHVEAGLRTYQRYSPFPEEINRRLTAVLAQWHFAPTFSAKQHLLNEGIPAEQIWVTGNTVIDTLQQTLQKIQQNPALVQQCASCYPFLKQDKKLILVTGHRRESFGDGVEQICLAIAKLAHQYQDVQFVYPVHLNPHVQAPVYRLLGNIENVFLIKPQEYVSFVYLMEQAYLILTDSGGIQEEATALSKPVLVMRETSERHEAIHAGSVKLVGTDAMRIVQHVQQLLDDQTSYQAMTQAQSPYGNGQASQYIVQILKQGYKFQYDQ